MSVISVRDLGKAFFTFHSEWQRIARWFGLASDPATVVWTLRHINFEMQAGETIGIVGQNGAGKSTLLKCITGTMQPTEGSIQVHGRIAAILELGMGFNGELTGRQNVIHAAGLMGFANEDIHRILPEIEEFAEIGDYFDEPVRTYSSGMQVRVSFAVATAIRPEILIVDEALSVGDAYFQHKSFNRIREFRDQGTTLLIVSHDPNTIKQLCDRAILLEAGQAIQDGLPDEVMDYYNALIAEKGNSTVEIKKLKDGKTQIMSGTGEARIEEIHLRNSRGELVEYIAVGEAVELHIKVKVHQPIESLVLGFGIKDRVGQVVFGTNTWYTEQIVQNPEAGDVYEYCLAFNAALGPGSYSVQTALHAHDNHLSHNYEWRELALLFTVVNMDKPYFIGCDFLDTTIGLRKAPRDVAPGTEKVA